MQPTVISDSVFIPAMIYDMEVVGDYLLLVYLGENQWLHVYDKTTGQHLKSAFFRGRGPSEIQGMVTRLSLDAKRENISLFDNRAEQLLTISVDSLMHGAFRPTTVVSDHFARADEVYPLAGDTLVFRLQLPADEDASRYFRFANDRVSARYFEYPVDDKELAFRLYGDYRLTISPDQTKMAVGTLLGAILECFDLSEGIAPVSRSYIREPFLNEERNLDVNASGLGFVDLYGTNDRLYTVFNGTGTMDFNNLTLFDWDGNPLSLHSTPYNLSKICVEPDQSVLYAVAVDPEKGNFLVSFPLQGQAKEQGNAPIQRFTPKSNQQETRHETSFNLF